MANRVFQLCVLLTIIVTLVASADARAPPAAAAVSSSSLTHLTSLTVNHIDRHDITTDTLLLSPGHDSHRSDSDSPPGLSLLLQNPPDVIYTSRGDVVRVPCGVTTTTAGGGNERQQHYNVTWLRGGDVVVDDSNSVLEIDSMNATWEGLYSCLVTTKEGALLSSPVHIRMASLGEFQDQPEDVISVPVQQPVVLPCSVTSLPPAHVTWLRNNEPLLLSNNNRKYIQLSSGSLLITRVHNTDVGSYRCRVYNPILQKSRLSRRAKLTIHGNHTTTTTSVDSSNTGSNIHVITTTPIQFVTRGVPTNVTIAYGKTTQLYCVLLIIGHHSSKTKASLHWYKDDVLLADDDTTTATTDSVSILSVNSSGNYTCHYGNYTSDSSAATSLRYLVTVTRPPYFVTRPPAVTVFPSARTVRLPCDVGGQPQPQVTWLKNGRRLVTTSGSRARMTSPGSTLLLSHSFTTDSAIYQCVGRSVNSVGEVQQVWSAALLVAKIPAEPPPAPPSNVRCRQVAANAICVEWSAVNTSSTTTTSSSSSSSVAYSVHTSREGVMLNELVSKTSHVTVTGLEAGGATYRFYVRMYRLVASDQSESVACCVEDWRSGGDDDSDSDGNERDRRRWFSVEITRNGNTVRNNSDNSDINGDTAATTKDGVRNSIASSNNTNNGYTGIDGSNNNSFSNTSSGKGGSVTSTKEVVRVESGSKKNSVFTSTTATRDGATNNNPRNTIHGGGSDLFIKSTIDGDITGSSSNSGDADNTLRDADITTVGGVVMKTKSTRDGVSIDNDNSASAIGNSSRNHTLVRWSVLSNDVQCGATYSLYVLKWRRKGTSDVSSSGVTNKPEAVIDTGLQAGVTYEFLVTVIAGPSSSDNTWQEYRVPLGDDRDVSVITTDTTSPQSPSLLQLHAPYRLRGTPLDGNTVLVTWRSPEPEHPLYFTLCYGTDSTVNCMKTREMDKVDENQQLTCVDRSQRVLNLTSNTVYDFKVRSHGIDGAVSPYTNPIQVRTLPDDLSASQSTDDIIPPLVVVVGGNTNTGHTSPNHHDNDNDDIITRQQRLGVIIGLSVSVTLLLSVCVTWLLWRRHNRQRHDVPITTTTTAVTSQHHHSNHNSHHRHHHNHHQHNNSSGRHHHNNHHNSGRHHQVIVYNNNGRIATGAALHEMQRLVTVNGNSGGGGYHVDTKGGATYNNDEDSGGGGGGDVTTMTMTTVLNGECEDDGGMLCRITTNPGHCQLPLLPPNG